MAEEEKGEEFRRTGRSVGLGWGMCEAAMEGLREDTD